MGFVPGVTLRKWRTVWEERFPRVPLDVVEVTETDQRTALTSGEVDLCLVRLPLDTAGLHLIRLYEEVRVAWSSKDHPIEAVADLTLDDLAGEEILDAATPEAIQQAARAAVQYLAQQFADIAREFDIAIDLDERIDPPWTAEDEAALAALAAKNAAEDEAAHRPTR